MKEENYKVHRMNISRTGLILIVTMATKIVCSAERVAPPRERMPCLHPSVDFQKESGCCTFSSKWTGRQGPCVTGKNESKKIADDVIIDSSDFNQLSRQEREEGLSDLHGVAESIQEDPLFVQEKLDQLEKDLSFITHRSALDRALFLNPHYVMNRNFRLSFLRADRFDTLKAARRMVDHFEAKLELFGFECLGRSITIKDLDKDTEELLRSGSFWLMDMCDRSGRRIFLHSGALHMRKPGIIVVRTSFFFSVICFPP